MSQNFINFTAVPYIGPIPQPRAVSLCAGAQVNVVPIIFNWGDYIPDAVIEIDLGAGGNVRPPLNAIRSIVVDNTFSTGSVQVRFPDTGFVVQCEQDASTSGFVLTNNFKIQVRRENTGVSVFTETTVYLCDFILDTYTQERLAPTLQLWRGSQTSPFFLDPVYSPATLGQRSAHVTLDLSLVGYGSGVSIFDNTVAWPLCVMKSFTLNIVGSYSSGISPIAAQLAFGRFAATPALQWSWYVRNNLKDYFLHLDTQDGLALLFDNAPTGAFGFKLYNALNAIPGATANLVITYDTLDGDFFF